MLVSRESEVGEMGWCAAGRVGSDPRGCRTQVGKAGWRTRDLELTSFFPFASGPCRMSPRGYEIPETER